VLDGIAVDCSINEIELIVCDPKDSKLLMPFPEKEINAILLAVADGRDSAVSIGERVIPIDEINDGDSIYFSLSTYSIGVKLNDEFCEKVLSS
jgi:hypothetical protein